MISSSTNPVEKPGKYMIDLNESAFKSKWRLLGFYRHVAQEVGTRKNTIEKNISNWSELTTQKIVKEINRVIGSNVVFYYGTGDEDPGDVMNTKPVVATKKTRKKRKASVQETLERNMIEATID